MDDINQADQSNSDADVWSWHEYRVGLVCEIVHAFVDTLMSFLIGLGVTFVLILAIALLGEEHLLGDDGLESLVDNLARSSIAQTMGLGFLAWAGSCLATVTVDVLTSKALVRATEHGASQRRVPSPEQMEAVTGEPAKNIAVLAKVVIVIAAFMALFGVVFAFGTDAGDGLLVLVMALVVAGAMLAVIVRLCPMITRAHDARRDRLAAHWSVQDEQKAWRPAWRKSATKPSTTMHRFPLADQLLYWASALVAIGFFVLQASLSVRCARVPSSTVPTECDETHYASPIELVLSWGFWIFAVLLALAVVLAVTGVLLQAHQRRTERNGLRHRLDDPGPAGRQRPDGVVLARHSRRPRYPLVTVTAALSAFVLVIGSGFLIAGHRTDLDPTPHPTFIGYQGIALGCVIGAVLLFLLTLVGAGVGSLQSRDFRNELMARWPVAPRWSSGEKGRVLRAKTGPALRGSRYTKVGKHKNSG